MRVKTDEERAKNKAYRKAYYWRNPERARAQAKAWADANPRRHSDATLGSHFRRNYGLSLEEYNANVIGQAGRCLLCHRVPNVRLGVDHDHRTGRIRGLLCQPCNRMLGSANDDPEVLRRGADYLERSR